MAVLAKVLRLFEVSERIVGEKGLQASLGGQISFVISVMLLGCRGKVILRVTPPSSMALGVVDR